MTWRHDVAGRWVERSEGANVIRPRSFIDSQAPTRQIYPSRKRSAQLHYLLLETAPTMAMAKIGYSKSTYYPQGSLARFSNAPWTCTDVLKSKKVLGLQVQISRPLIMFEISISRRNLTPGSRLIRYRINFVDWRVWSFNVSHYQQIINGPILNQVERRIMKRQHCKNSTQIRLGVSN